MKSVLSFFVGASLIFGANLSSAVIGEGDETRSRFILQTIHETAAKAQPSSDEITALIAYTAPFYTYTAHPMGPEWQFVYELDPYVRHEATKALVKISVENPLALATYLLPSIALLTFARLENYNLLGVPVELPHVLHVLGGIGTFNVFVVDSIMRLIDESSAHLPPQRSDLKLKAILVLKGYVDRLLLINPLIEILEQNEAQSQFMLIAMELLGESGTWNSRAVEALKKIALGPMSFRGAELADLLNLRPTAVKILGKISTQQSVDALWEIAGLDTTPTKFSRPLPDTEQVIKEAERNRRHLLRQGHFVDRPLRERFGRALQCAVAFIR